MKAILTALLLFLFLLPLSAQMVQPNGSVRYGHEWIRPGAEYLRIAVVEDGPYRIPAEQIAAQGWSLTGPEASRLQLWHMGDSIPIHITEEGVHFFGEQNRGELDRYLFSDPDAQQLNPRYSMFTDTAIYYLELLPEGDEGLLRYDEVENEIAPGAPSVPYILRTSERVFEEHAMKAYARIGGESIYYSHFDVAEGFGSRKITNFQSVGGVTSTLKLETPKAVPVQQSGNLKLRFGVGFDYHRQELYIDGEFIDTFTRSSWGVFSPILSVPTDQLVDGQVQIKLHGTGGDRDKVSIAFAQLQYPALPNAEEASYLPFSLPANNQPTLLNLTDVPSNGMATLFDLTDRRLYRAPIESGTVRFGLPATSEEHRFMFIAGDAWLSTDIRSVSYPEVTKDPIDFLIITSERLLSEGDAISQYADYRGSEAGGGYQVRITTVEEIYERHSYGIARHPMAIRNYLHRLQVDQDSLKYLLLIGKGREYPAIRTPAELNAAGNTFQVPTFGRPGSDILLSGDTRDGTLATLATGRLPAINNAEVAIYLEKLQIADQQYNEPQTLAAKGWMKNVLHLGGGIFPWEQNTIRGQLESMENIIERGKFGANVQGVYKTSSEPIQNTRLDQIFEIINGGTSLVTFFGHSDPNTFELKIDTPESYDNSGRCPLMLSLGCYSGNHFINGRSVGEEFLFLKKRGAIGFGAANSYGFTSSLSLFGQKYYENLSGPYYNAGMGEVLLATLQDLADASSDYLYLGLAEQYNLQGDPAFKLYTQPGPDFVFNPEAIRLNPSVPNAQADSFAVEYQIVNLGENLPIDSLSVRFRQMIPTGVTKELAVRKVALNGAVSDLVAQVPNLGQEAIGNNRLSIELDATGDITELPQPAAETNNTLVNANGQAGLPFFVVSNTAFPVYPPRYALVGEEAPVLKISTSNPLAPQQNYLLQLDTSLAFIQPLAASEMVANGGVLEWQPDVSWQDSTVYYWRVRPDSTVNTQIDSVWETTSFLYLSESSNGWGQGHIDQWRDNSFEQIELNPEQQEVFTFSESIRDVEIRNQVDDATGEPHFFDQGKLFGSPWKWNINEGVSVVVLSYPDLEYKLNRAGGLHGSVNNPTPAWPDVVLAFSFPTKEQNGRNNLINFLDEVVPDSSYVLLYTLQRNFSSSYSPEDWASDSLTNEGRNLFNLLEEQGARQIRSTATLGARPYTIFYQKNVGPIVEQLADSLSEAITLKHSFIGKWFEGSFTTVPIGPSTEWKSIKHHYLASQQPTYSDSVRLDVIGISPTEEEVLLDSFPDFTPNKDYDISNISAELYPRLKLRLFVLDKKYRTIPPIRNLIVYYEGLPDLAITDAQLRTDPADTLSQGAPWGLRYRVVNIGPYDVPATAGDFRLGELGRLDAQQGEFMLPALSRGQSWSDTIVLQTDSLLQRSSFSLQINPQDKPREQYRFNNALNSELNIRRDIQDPVISVAFDGRTILDGEIVAPQPNISIVLIDDNPQLRLNEPDLVRLWIQMPEQANFTLIPREEYQWTAAPAEGENRASILYQPGFTADGVYRLRVAAEDRSGNAAGRSLYEISFEVITRRTLSNVLPYPNPFTTSTRFVYTLTGAEPAEFRIQIMTVSGRIVREITKAEIGPLYVGTHQTEYAWDGRDEYGDQLANGVYLYRVIVRDEENQDYELRTNGTESYFQNGIGKIVLLR